MTTYITMHIALHAHDPIIARDGRPFGVGQRMKSLNWPYPSVLAGSMRTMLGKINGGFSNGNIENLLDIHIAGPLPMVNTQLYLPIPNDILAEKVDEKAKAISLRPVALEEYNGCNFPIPGLYPSMIPEKNDDFKPEKLPVFWSIKKMTEWLANPNGIDFNLCRDSEKEDEGQEGERDEKKKDNCWDDDPDFLDAPKKDKRIHAGIDRIRGAAEDGMLFMSIGLDLASRFQGCAIHLSARVRSDKSSAYGRQISELDEIHPFGGERRLAHWFRADEPAGWKCPPEIPSKLTELNSGKIRMVLATPAIFSNGWLPGWLDPKSLEGIPPGARDGQKLKLISACTDRWRPISGWSAEAKSRGPKAIRRMVPAGSVYFFEAKSAKAASDIAMSHWLEPVCDKPQDCKDGFGLAVWGVWDKNESEDEN